MVALSPRQEQQRSHLRVFLGAFFLDTFGDLLWYVTLGWVAGRAPNGAIAGLIICAGALPAMLLAPLGGALMARIGTAKATLYTMTARSLVMVAWIVAIAVDATPLAVLPVLAFVLGCIDGLHRPALDTWPMDVSTDASGHVSEGVQSRIAGLEGVIGRLAQMAAGLAGGFLLNAWGLTAPTVVAAAAFVIALGVFRYLMTRMYPHGSQSETGESMLKAAKGGFGSVRSHPVLSRTMTVHGVYNALTAGFALAGIPLRVRALGWDVSRFGVIYAWWAAGLLLGSLLFLRYEKRVSHKVRVSLGLVVAAGCLCALAGLTDSYPVMIVDAALLGLVCGPVGPGLRGYLRETIKNRADRGPIQGVQSLAFDGTEPFGYFVVGALIAVAGASVGCVVTGILIVGLGIWALSGAEVRAAVS